MTNKQAPSATSDNTKIDYTFVHNKKCELIKYLESRKVVVSEQMEYDIKGYLQDIAFNESERKSQAPSATDWKQMYEDERKIVSDIWDALGIKTYQDAKGKSIVELVRELKAPSATVDEIARDCRIELGVGNKSGDETEEIIKQAITKALHSQQPTVDVDVLWEKWKSATMQVNILGDKRDIVFKIAFEHAIQEALRGSYTRSDLANFANMISLADDGEKFEENAMNDLLTQYDTERGKSNG